MTTAVFKSGVYLADWLIGEITNQIMKIFGKREKPENSSKNLSEQSRDSTNASHIWRRTQATLLEGEWSQHSTKPALSMKPLKSFATMHLDQKHAHIICDQKN